MTLLKTIMQKTNQTKQKQNKTPQPNNNNNKPTAKKHQTKTHPLTPPSLPAL